MSGEVRLRAAAGLRCLAAGLACGLASLASAAVYPGAKAPSAAIEQHLGATLPLDAPFIDASGHPVHLGDYFRAEASPRSVPVIVVLGYYRCRNLCQTEMEGVLQALAESGLPRRDYRVLAVSIDPEETAADAVARRRIDLQVADLLAAPATGAAARGPLVIDALVGPAASIERLAARAGFLFTRVADGTGDDDRQRAFAHAAGFVVATPDGRISRYFLGVRHDPAALRQAIDDARGDAIGSAVESLLLLCAHLDPTVGRFTAGVMLALRCLGLGLVVWLAAWVWRHRRAPAFDPRT